MPTKDAADTNSENMLVKIAGMVAGSFLKINPLLVKDLFESLKRETPVMSNATWDGWCDKLVINELCDQDTANSLKELATYPFPWGGLLMILSVLQVKMTDLKSIMEIYTLDRQYANMAKTTPHPAPLDNLVRSMIIDPARSGENRVEMAKHGLSPLQIDNVILSYYRTIGEGEIRTNFLRGNITSDQMFVRMREIGYTDERTKEIIQTWSLIPGPQDLLHMVAKEAFEPDTIALLGLGDEFPVDQLPAMEAQGVSEEWTKKYWYAHWDQPSIGQGFEMLQRGVINMAELDVLFKTVEIPPYWRDKLTKIAYSPYTRVDVRRMHDMDILSDQELLTAYMDLGYDAEKALNMAKFTIKYNTGNEQALTRSAVLESYEENLITRSEALEMLTDQDYDEDLADWYITMSDYNRDKALQKLVLDNVKEEYLLGITSITQARESLNKMGLLGEKINLLIESWELDQYKYQSIPSKSDLDRFLVKGIITEGEYSTYMVRHGFSYESIAWFMEDLHPGGELESRAPTRADIVKWYKAGLITPEQWTKEMQLLGYSDKHISLIFKSL